MVVVTVAVVAVAARPAAVVLQSWFLHSRDGPLVVFMVFFLFVLALFDHSIDYGESIRPSTTPRSPTPAIRHGRVVAATVHAGYARVLALPAPSWG